MPKISAIFLDRDGVINEKIENGYVKTWDEFKLLPGAIDAIKYLNDKNISVYVISNQSGIGRGRMTFDDLKTIHNKMIDKLRESGAHLDDIFVCPHAPADDCDCRKPKPGLFIMAKTKHPEINFRSSWFIGDSISDVQAGQAVQCNTYQIKKGENLLEVVNKIINGN